MWYNDYVGLPYANNGRVRTGIDCWGLACLVYKEQFNIVLPTFDNEYNGLTGEGIQELLAQHKEGWEEVKQPEVGDICLFRVLGEPQHIGVYVGEGKFLHVREGYDSVIELLQSYSWSKRLLGFYRYKSGVQLVGVPHPLHTQKVALDWTVAGTSVAQFVEFIKQKYGVSEQLIDRVVVTVDGVPVTKDQWETTTLMPGQIAAYRVLPGKSAARLLMAAAVSWFAFTYLPGLEALSGSKFVAGLASVTTQAVGMALIDAIAPIRVNSNDPGTTEKINLFTSASNQQNRFGPIPVVLGRARVTAMLGAQPYIESLPSGSLLRMMLVWGYGPLLIDDMRIGTTPIDSYYQRESRTSTNTAPVTLFGTSSEDSTDLQARFDVICGEDVEQQIVQEELLNNTEANDAITNDPPWIERTLGSDITELGLAFTFPEGLRKVNKQDGSVSNATCQIEVQFAPAGPGSYPTSPAFSLGQAYSDILEPLIPPIEGTTSTYYTWYTLTLGPDRHVHKYAGTPTADQNAEPSAEIKAAYDSTQSNSDLTYTRLPQTPSDHIPLYDVCVRNTNTPFVTSITRLGGYTTSGLVLTHSNIVRNTSTLGDDYVFKTDLKAEVSVGSITQRVAEGTPATGDVQVILDSLSLAGSGSLYNAVSQVNPKSSQLLKQSAIWSGSAATTNFDVTLPDVLTLPVSGYYSLVASSDDQSNILIDGSSIVKVPQDGWKQEYSALFYKEAGTYDLRIVATNTGGPCGVAFKLTYNPANQLNAEPQTSTIITLGNPGGSYSQAKDAFNFVWRVPNLPSGSYKVRVRRLNSDESEPASDPDNHYYHKVLLYSITGYNSSARPATNPRGVRIAKTALSIHSSDRANGSLDGVNALVQSVGYDWNSVTQQWEDGKPLTNPASLFLHVLLHPANTYRYLNGDNFDLPKFQHWHEFCNANGFTYSDVVNSTKSVMEVLRDIAAAGRASPAMVDGKWTVLIDEPRTTVTQLFTPHNSWGFESTKALPKIPHAFRITFPEASNGYQAKEIYVFNTGYSLDGASPGTTEATIYEELTLPGVTDSQHAISLAQWHFAQLRMRPETYTLNADFEYIVCTRGDRVRVSHPVPLWGIGTGRVKAITGNQLTLTETVSLESGKQYVIRIRTNTGTQVRYELAAHATGQYGAITLTTAPAGVEVNDLFVLGEISGGKDRDSQDLIVLSVEPTSNTSARLTLVDYSEEIYTTPLDLLVYDPNVTTQNDPIQQNTISVAPAVVEVTSYSDNSQEVSPGVYMNNLKVVYVNPIGLPMLAEKVEMQIVLSASDIDSATSANTYTVDKYSSVIVVPGVTTGQGYKLRLRYTSIDKKVVGPWSDLVFTVISGRTENNFQVLGVDAYLDRNYLVMRASSQDLLSNPSFKHYEFRVLKGDTSTVDFWDLDMIANNIKMVQSRDIANLDLLQFSTPRITEAGVPYRIACRAVDTSGNYSNYNDTGSALGSVLIKTIT